MNDLPTQYLLLATHDRSGRPLGYHQYGFGAAVLAEMVLSGHLELRGRRIHVGTRPEDPLYATVWHDVRSRRIRKARWWVSKISGGRYRLLRRQFMQRLVDGGLVREEPGVFRPRYPTADGTVEDALRQRIADAVEHEDTSDDRLVCLVAITVAAQSGRQIHLDRRTRRRIHRAARRWMKSNDFARSVNELIQAVTMVIIASTMAATSG